MATKKKTEITIPFDDAMKELESLVRRLEQGELPLEESMAVYQRGIELTQILNKKLDQMEKKIEVLSGVPAADASEDTKDGV